MGKKVYFVLLLSIFASGCASLTYRMDSSKREPAVYPAVKTDVAVMSSVTSKGDHGEMAGGEAFFYTLAFIDIPLAAVVDTVMLPFDLAGMSEAKK